jgi:glucose-1-phosphatase
MIKNIVFDLGNVLISFRPAEYFEKKDYPENMKSRILADIFGSPEWHFLDNGDITISEAIESIAGKSSLSRQEIAHIFNLRTDLMFPLDQNVRILPELKKEGYGLYYLSNFPLDIFEEIKNGYYFFRYFDGGIISSEVKHSKPERKIFEILLENYSLIPEECLFIDDIEANVATGIETGMKGFMTGGSTDIKKRLIEILSTGKVSQ